METDGTECLPVPGRRQGIEMTRSLGHLHVELATLCIE